MGLSASQGRMLLLTARKSDLEYRAQQISQKRLVLSQQLESISLDYEEATSNRQMSIALYLSNTSDNGQSVTMSKANLTYAALVGGTVKNYSSALTGIKAYDRTADQEYTSTTAYRLVDAEGAIVISDIQEIPGTLSKTVVSKTSPDEDGIYRAGEYNISGNREKDGGNYAVVPKNPNGTVTALGADLAKATECFVDAEKGIVMLNIPDKDGKASYKYYNFKTGGNVNYTDDNFPQDTKLNFVNNEKDIPTSKKEMLDNATIQEGGDGKYSLLDKNGVVLQRYVVDNSLKYGSTDQNGSIDGPNYLQDCMRNGKYLLQKLGTPDENGKSKWNSISWDATANISDSYYLEDDDKAKAKYDRLQNQIQAQDKKLELELDNIETQRSAVTTEVESVQKVIDDNIEGSFKVFA